MALSMKYSEMRVAGAFLIEIEPVFDERGFFARAWCRDEFKARDLDSNLVQCNISFNKPKGTLRGMHYQVAPFAETKLVRCTRGALYDVVLDLRPESPTFKKWAAVRLTAEARNMVYVPKGCAHGFLTLQPETEVFYQMSEIYSAESARGVRYDDPFFGIHWPEEIAMISDRDRTYPDFSG